MRLAINIDHIATLRNARGGVVPDPVLAARACERAGAHGIVCHLREDRRHIRDTDVKRLRAEIQTRLDLEMAATPEIIQIARQVKPDLATLVPEKRAELTTEGGLDVAGAIRRIADATAKLQDAGILVSLFVDPIRRQVEAAKEVGADMIEIHTGKYADAIVAATRVRHLASISTIAAYASSLGLRVNAGHGLNYTNIKPIARIRDIEEVSIGHAVIVEAVTIGLAEAVRKMLRLMRSV